MTSRTRAVCNVWHGCWKVSASASKKVYLNASLIMLNCKRFKIKCCGAYERMKTLSSTSDFAREMPGKHNMTGKLPPLPATPTIGYEY